MNIAELMEDLRDGYAPQAYYEVLTDFAPEGSRNTDWRFACNMCGREVDPTRRGGACPDHGPGEVPGLALAECWAEPQHPPVWTIDGDHAGYGFPCPQCRLAPYWAADAAARQCRHWSWRRWRITGWALNAALRLGITAYTGGWQSGDGHNRCRSMPGWHGERRYVLGFRIKPREEIWC